MEIKWKNFIMVADDDRFNLYRERKIEKKGSKNFGKITRYEIGWSYRFGEAIKRIIELELAKREDVTTLKGYIEEYRKLVKELKETINVEV